VDEEYRVLLFSHSPFRSSPFTRQKGINPVQGTTCCFVANKNFHPESTAQNTLFEYLLIIVTIQFKRGDRPTREASCCSTNKLAIENISKHAASS
jgi:hypothetical protein